MNNQFVFSRDPPPQKGSYVFIGPAPGKKGIGNPVFSGNAGTSRKIADLIGIDMGTLFTELTWAVNLLPDWPGYNKHGPGDRFFLDQARENAQQLLSHIRGCYLIMLGQNVERAFSLDRKPFFLWFPFNKAQAVIIPHPSGLNRWWNSDENKKIAQRFFDGLKLKILRHAKSKTLL